MKKVIGYILCLILIIGLNSCTSVVTNEKNTIEWITTNQKPIACFPSGFNQLGNRKYTLISKDNQIYFTNGVRLKLPEIIK